MTDRDALLAAELDARFPVPDARPDWQSVRRASRPPRGRIVVAAVVLLATIFGILPALGIGRDVLWRQTSGGREYGYTYAAVETPDGRVEFRASRGEWLGITTWLDGRLIAGGGGPDDSLHGIGHEAPRYAGLFGGSIGPKTQFATSAVAKEVGSVELELADGTTRPAAIVRPPNTVHTDLRFYYAVLPRRPTIVAVVAKAADGSTLERQRLYFGAASRSYRIPQKRRR